MIGTFFFKLSHLEKKFDQNFFIPRGIQKIEAHFLNYKLATFFVTVTLLLFVNDFAVISTKEMNRT